MNEKIEIRKDEWYPVYVFSICSDEGIPISDKKLKQMIKVFNDFKKLQDELYKIYEGNE